MKPPRSIEPLMITVLKLGGELLDDAAALAGAAAAIVRLSNAGPLVVVHGGGRAIDAELRARGREPRFVDGLRVTDADALDAVVCILAGRTNTALVAAVGHAGARAVGLTGADAQLGRARRAGTLTAVSGEQVDLGLVGEPGDGDVALLHHLFDAGYVPVVASVGVDDHGALLNVNADTLAAHLSGALGAGRLILAGGTAGVLDSRGHSIARLTPEDIDALAASGTAHSGMLAKLSACRRALESGVRTIAIVAGRGVHDFETAVGTRIEAKADAGPEPRTGPKLRAEV
jgi:acetylglutamate kinase